MEKSPIEGMAPQKSHQIEDINLSDQARLAAIRRKIDLRLLPVLTVLYLMSFIDRGNSKCLPPRCRHSAAVLINVLVGNARVAGLDKTLNLSDKQYNLCLTIFFFPYALFEVPSNIVLKLLRPTIWLTILVLCWGTVMTLMGIVQNYAGLLAARFFLGLTEVW